MPVNHEKSFCFPAFFERLIRYKSPANLVCEALERNREYRPEKDSPLVVALGKASEAMVEGLLEANVPVERILMVSPTLAKKDLSLKLMWLKGNHPFPGKESFAAGRDLLSFIRSGKPGQRLLGLMSGGASALVSFPCAGLTEADKSKVHEALVSSGRSIHDMNLVRRHLSEGKGGGLLRIALELGMNVRVLALSDVIGDFPHDIGSGPLAPDPTTFLQALEIARAIPGIPVPALQILAEGVRGERRETLKPLAVPSGSWAYEVVANRAFLLDSAKKQLFDDGFHVEIWRESLSGNPRQCASAFLDWIETQGASGMPLAFCAAGEAEVCLEGHQPVGKGGRACALVLELAIQAFERGQKLNLAVAATDGIDGNSGTAGGFLLASDLSPELVKEMQRALKNFDSGSWLCSMGRSFPTCITGTNLGDLLIASPEKDAFRASDGT